MKNKPDDLDPPAWIADGWIVSKIFSKVTFNANESWLSFSKSRFNLPSSVNRQNRSRSAINENLATMS